jgi:uncharacterized membrane protein YdfJ with MMPL/SSD domain
VAGIAIDYSLLVVSRWREERAHGANGDEAIWTRWRPPARGARKAAKILLLLATNNAFCLAIYANTEEMRSIQDRRPRYGVCTLDSCDGPVT